MHQPLYSYLANSSLKNLKHCSFNTHICLSCPHLAFHPCHLFPHKLHFEKANFFYCLFILVTCSKAICLIVAPISLTAAVSATATAATADVFL